MDRGKKEGTMDEDRDYEEEAYNQLTMHGDGACDCNRCDAARYILNAAERDRQERQANRKAFYNATGAARLIVDPREFNRKGYLR